MSTRHSHHGFTARSRPRRPIHPRQSSCSHISPPTHHNQTPLIKPSRTYRPKYAHSSFTRSPLNSSPKTRPTTTNPHSPNLTVQKTPRTRKNRTNPLPRQPNRQHHLRFPAPNSAGSTNRQGRFRRRSPESSPLKSRYTRLPTHRLHTWPHHHSAGRPRQPVDPSTPYGCRCAVVGGYAPVRSL